MGLKLITAPTQEPITLAEAKAHLRVTVAAEDSLVTALIVAARQDAENFAGRAFITQTWDYVLDSFPRRPLFELPKAPLQSVTSVKYLDLDGVEQTLDPSLYKVDAVTDPGRIAPAFGEAWPATRSEPNAVTIRLVAGYGLASAVPQAIKQAVLLLVQYNEQRDANEAVLQAAENLLSPYRVLRL